MQKKQKCLNDVMQSRTLQNFYKETSNIVKYYESVIQSQGGRCNKKQKKQDHQILQMQIQGSSLTIHLPIDESLGKMQKWSLKQQ